MAKIHPNTRTCMLDFSEGQYLSSERQEFTVWMKSLVINGNGCTVFNRKGELVFRLDNYQTMPCTHAFLMDHNGQLLFSIETKKRALGRTSWLVQKWTNSSKSVAEKGECFRVRRNYSSVFGRGIACDVIAGCNKGWSNQMMCSYKIEGLQGKLTVKVVDGTGKVLAEMLRKQSKGGVSLGDDVLSLTVEPQIDQSLIMALLIVYAMINHKL